jgi:hypothetical protein
MPQSPLVWDGRIAIKHRQVCQRDGRQLRSRLRDAENEDEILSIVLMTMVSLSGGGETDSAA